jgi:endonuclease/exonuclease/phosphatase family metal-dependent hydrolase
MTQQRLRICTLNTWKNEGDYSARLDRMATALRWLAPDLLLLQECFRTDDGRVDTADTLARELGMESVVAPARAKPRLWQGALLPSTSGLALLTRWPVRESERLLLPSDERGGERIALIAQIATPVGEIVVANIHLSHLRNDSPMRARQLDTLMASSRWQQPAAARFFGGDLNADAESPELSGLAAHPSLAVIDTARLADTAVPLPATHPLPARLGRGSRRIDFVFAVTPREQEHPRWENAGVSLAVPINGVYVSDHAAVTADLVLPPAVTSPISPAS